jgi:predicted metal-dependent HD superfamily phosphohydrolase
MLKQTFIQLIKNYTTDDRLVQQLWEDVENNYSGKKRYYHNLLHLHNLLNLLHQAKDQIKEWDAILFALYYHDIVYNPLRTNNEDRSAEFAENKMQLIEVPKQIINQSVQQILATKKHSLSIDNDTNIFTDADLSILGQEWDLYAEYYKQVRKEYSLFPDLIYVPGRKKVIQHFLQMPRIFKTDFFFEKFEMQAKENLQKELNYF